MFIPYRVDVPFDHPPVVNRILVLVVIVIFALQVADVSQFMDQGGTAKEYMEKGTMARLVLRGWGIKGIFGYMWLHGGGISSVREYDFPLAVRQRRVLEARQCPLSAGLRGAWYNSGRYPPYILRRLDDRGQCGNKRYCWDVSGVFSREFYKLFFWLIFYPVRFSVSGYWMILLWFGFDVLGALLGRNQLGGVAYLAHITGFLAGFALAIIMLKKKYIVMLRDEKSLLELLGFEKKQKPEELRRDIAYWQQEFEKSETEKAGLGTIPPEPEKPKEELIRFNCICGQKIKTAMENAGKIVRCPKCSTRWKVPEQS